MTQVWSWSSTYIWCQG